MEEVHQCPDGGTVSLSLAARARLLEKGPEALSDVELLMLLHRETQRTAVRETLDRASCLLENAGGLRSLAQASFPELLHRDGVEPQDAAAIAAAFELGRRALCTHVENGASFRSSLEVFEHFRSRLIGARKEVFMALLLDAKHRKLREVRVSEGSLTASIVHPREVFGPAVRESAAALILVHNHPSGDPSPSTEDCHITRRLRDAGEILGIRVLDHVVIGANSHFSFVDAGRW